MIYKYLFTELANESLSKISQPIKKRIIKKLEFFLNSNEPLSFAKKLTNYDAWRFRVGNYRIIFKQDPKTKNLVILVILKIAHRKDIYE